MHQKTKLKLIFLSIFPTTLLIGCNVGNNSKTSNNLAIQTNNNSNANYEFFKESPHITITIENNNNSIDNGLQATLLNNKGTITDANISWNTDTSNIIEINAQTGKITAKQLGIATINAIVGNIGHNKITTNLNIDNLNLLSSQTIQQKFYFKDKKHAATNGKNQYLVVDGQHLNIFNSDSSSKTINISEVFLEQSSNFNIEDIAYNNGKYALLINNQAAKLNSAVKSKIILLDEEQLKDPEFKITQNKIIEKHISQEFLSLEPKFTKIIPITGKDIFLVTNPAQNKLAIVKDGQLYKAKNLYFWLQQIKPSHNSQFVYGNDQLIIYDNNLIAYYSINDLLQEYIPIPKFTIIKKPDNYKIDNITYNPTSKEFIVLATQLDDTQKKYIQSIVAIISSNNQNQLTLETIHTYSYSEDNHYTDITYYNGIYFLVTDSPVHYQIIDNLTKLGLSEKIPEPQV